MGFRRTIRGWDLPVPVAEGVLFVFMAHHHARRRIVQK
jgi:hypothetical protein